MEGGQTDMLKFLSVINQYRSAIAPICTDTSFSDRLHSLTGNFYDSFFSRLFT